MVEIHHKQVFLATILIAAIAFNQNYHIVSSTPNAVPDTSPWWSNWSRDLDHNKIDDILEGRLRTQSSGYNDLVALFINYDHPLTKDDAKVLSHLSLTPSYTAKYINTISIRNVSISAVPFLASLPGVVMVELQPHIYPILDISTRSIKARESAEYSPNTAWQLGYTGKDLSLIHI